VDKKSIYSGNISLKMPILHPVRSILNLKSALERNSRFSLAEDLLQALMGGYLRKGGRRGPLSLILQIAFLSQIYSARRPNENHDSKLKVY